VRGGSFNEAYAPGWFDQVEFCHLLRKAGGQIWFEPKARFVSNANVPIIDRMVRDQYLQYRIAERRFIRNHFGKAAASLARVVLTLGMIQRIVFSLALPAASRRRLLTSLRSYVNDEYIRNLRGAYWAVLKRAVRGPL